MPFLGTRFVRPPPHVEAGVGLIFVGFGLFLLLTGVNDCLSQARYLGFPTIPATVVSSSVIRWQSRGDIRYTPSNTYRFQAFGSSWTSAHDFIARDWEDQAQAVALSAQYSPGQHIAVYVSPLDPRQSYLFHKAFFTPYVQVMVSMLMLTVGSMYLGLAAGMQLSTIKGVAVLAAPVHAVVGLVLIVQRMSATGHVVDGQGLLIMLYTLAAAGVACLFLPMLRQLLLSRADTR